MQYRSFIDARHQCVPHIVFMTPRTDVCQACENFCIAIQWAVSENEKENLLDKISAHLSVAQKERDAYLAAIEKSKEASIAAGDGIPKFIHLTFDFAQQVFLFFLTMLVRLVLYTTRYFWYLQCPTSPNELHFQ